MASVNETLNFETYIKMQPFFAEKNVKSFALQKLVTIFQQNILAQIDFMSTVTLKFSSNDFVKLRML